MAKGVQRGVQARTANKHKRRENILTQARQLITDNGYHAFTLSELASQADVTVPTIHNLIGNKQAVLRQLVEDMVAKIDQILTTDSSVDPVAACEIFIDNLISLYREDESFYRAAFVVGEQQKWFEHTRPEGIFRKSLDVAKRICTDALNQGFLEGKVKTDVIAEQLFANQRLARHDWIHGYIDLSEYRQQVLCGMYLTFAADASVSFHQTLMTKIRTLQA